MLKLSELERMVLEAIADQVPSHARELREQIVSATVVARENTGVGFYTHLAVVGPKMKGAASPLGDIGADVAGLNDGMGFMLWVKDGLAAVLEAYTHTGSTDDFDLGSLRGCNVRPRLPHVRFPPMADIRNACFRANCGCRRP